MTKKSLKVKKKNNDFFFSFLSSQNKIGIFSSLNNYSTFLFEKNIAFLEKIVVQLLKFIFYINEKEKNENFYAFVNDIVAIIPKMSIQSQIYFKMGRFEKIFYSISNSDFRAPSNSNILNVNFSLFRY